MKPIEGAESEGALGFFKGVGKGLVGYCNLSIKVSTFLKNPLHQRGHQTCYRRVRLSVKRFRG